MITKAQIHFVRDLHDRKVRLEKKLFFAEGTKVVKELLRSFELHSLYASQAWVEKEEETLSVFSEKDIFISQGKEIERMSALKTPQEVLAVFHMPEESSPVTLDSSGLVLALDHVSDPGNLGTIVRTADWYGIDHIICSLDSVDIWSPKVVQATMGSLGRVHVHYENLQDILSEIDIPILATAMTGSPVTSYTFPKDCILLMGNESLGVSEELFSKASEKVHISSYHHKNSAKGQAESLNVAMATGIMLQEYRRHHSD